MSISFQQIQESLTATFQKILEEEQQGGASLALYHRGKEILSLYGGWKDDAKTKPWEADTITLIWSAGKGIGSACLLHALQEHQISLDQRVSEFWPEFAQAGKEKITLAELLSHRAGLAALDKKGLSPIDHECIARELAAQVPNWHFDGGHGYGAKTFGCLLDELLRRITGVTSLSQYWRHTFAAPLELDLWFGIPESLLSKTADVIPAKTAPPPSDFGTAYRDHFSLTRRAFMEPGGNFSTLSMNQPALRQASIISSGAISSAHALAKFYSLLATQERNPYFNTTTRRWMETPMTSGCDRVLMAETSFSAGFMMSGNLNIFPTRRSFGHPGAGGAIGFAIPEQELGFAFLPNAMHHGIFSNQRTERLVRCLS